MKATSWNEKNARQKAGSIGFILGIFLACTLIAYAAVQLWGSKSKSIPFVKGHYFEMDLTGVGGGAEVVPGYQQSLNTVAVANKSNTDQIYAFIEFDFDPNVYKITDVSGWEEVQSDVGSVVYSFSSDGEMNEVDMKGQANFSGTLTCVADSATFQVLTDEDLAVEITGYAISTSVCASSNMDAWTDYQNGGRQ